MKRPDDLLRFPRSHTEVRRAIAGRVAAGHQGIDDTSLLALVSGSVVDALADERSDVDMSIAFNTLADEATLQAACARGGGTPWFWRSGALADGALVVAFHVEGIEVQIAYVDHATLRGQLDELVVKFNPDTPLHKLGEGLLKADALAGAERLAALQARLDPFPAALGRAMVEHFLKTPTPWRAVRQIVHRDAALWCRELQVEACYGLFGVLAGLNGRYFTRFQVKRIRRFAAGLTLAPDDFAARVEALLAAPPAEAFALLHSLEGEVIALVARRHPDMDLSPIHGRRAGFA